MLAGASPGLQIQRSLKRLGVVGSTPIHFRQFSDIGPIAALLPLSFGRPCRTHCPPSLNWSRLALGPISENWGIVVRARTRRTVPPHSLLRALHSLRLFATSLSKREARFTPEAMKRNTLCLLFLGVLLFGGCARPLAVERAQSVQHVVVMWLKDSGNAEHREQLLRAGETFRKIPGVLDIRGGTRLESGAVPTDGKPDYDLAVVITLRSMEDLQAYQKHPLHRKAVEEVLTPLVREILVYDFFSEI